MTTNGLQKSFLNNLKDTIWTSENIEIRNWKQDYLGIVRAS